MIVAASKRGSPMVRTLTAISSAALAAFTLSANAADFPLKEPFPVTNPDELVCTGIPGKKRRLCQTPTKEFGAGNTSSTTKVIRFEAPDGYAVDRATIRGMKLGGRCKFSVSYQPVPDNLGFECVWFTEGCGAFKDGGYVRGYCTVETYRIPSK